MCILNISEFSQLSILPQKVLLGWH